MEENGNNKEEKGMISAVKYVVSNNYANFKGRASRSEYWYYNLATILLSMIINLVTKAIGVEAFFGEIGAIVYLLLLAPSISVAVRRLHDTGHSGWCYLVGMIPLIGNLWLLYLLVKNSEKKDNFYGAYPPRYF